MSSSCACTLAVCTIVVLLHISRLHHSCVFSRLTRKWRLASRTAFSVASELRLTNPLEAISEVPIPPFGESHCHQKWFLSSNILSFIFFLGSMLLNLKNSKSIVYSSYILSYHPSAWTHPHPLSCCFINIFISFEFCCNLGFNKWNNQHSVLSDKQSLRLFSGVDFEHK